METRHKTLFRVSELADLRRQLQESASPQEMELRHRAVERMKAFRDSMPVISGDVKDWIRADRGELESG
jgi:hypothetical protein